MTEEGKSGKRIVAILLALVLAAGLIAWLGAAQLEKNNRSRQQSEGEVQQTYAMLMEDLIGKMREVTTQIAKEKGYDLVVEVTEGGVVYVNPTHDITAELIKRFDAKTGG